MGKPIYAIPIAEKIKKKIERNKSEAELFNRNSNKSDMQTSLRNSTYCETKDSKEKLTTNKQHSTVWQIRLHIIA